jgi:GH18 family chitinase
VSGGEASESGFLEHEEIDTQASVDSKCAYVKENQIAGLSDWRMGNNTRATDDDLSTFPITGGCAIVFSGTFII